MPVVTLTLVGCDDETTIEHRVTADQLAFVQELQAAFALVQGLQTACTDASASH